ncbi:sigma-70 family RNA polymerase sigma factor [Myxococcus sp. CA051A]|uniref:Sigma-70 family RNA polymerase sigma factor n=1 Tax=Myxococcus llanfairpwllgwyngyllgogerychwyrndrobwllllantysiliogogogochensis TaxID=2590453 RepID=A0A540WZN2_9BACT|nr:MULTISPECIES: sigma-70 family RNA polymerase sigma factor [Myxococcus]NTX04237.1 sigma-70 family RNA polymerase sigma factor [Myxococcus sp. CA040A]NTX64713.1 sigma-70 family RNA polymerase sigma factor [Myxococcus sp. CA051A]TQF14478.1 sigma-70 family RNA polymerase sigma factor [Myxococcus llanfairpwllgwyngyllgogerychwyrndrobwllllantysiliogogogochensis]
MHAAVIDLPPLTQLYNEHRARALAIARRIVGDADDAEDVVQDVFARLAWKSPGYGGRAAWTTWLHRVMVNSSINWLRARKRRERLSLEPSEPLTPEVQAVGAELERHFTDAMQEINEQQRQVLHLREVRGLSYPEIARLLRIPEGTVKSTLHRARQRTFGLMEERGHHP